MTDALKTLSAVIQRKHLALNTEQIFFGWLKRYCNYLQTLPLHLPGELTLERFLTASAQNHVSVTSRIKHLMSSTKGGNQIFLFIHV